LKDPSGLFNSSLDGSARRAIDIHEGDKVDEAALKDLIALQWRSISRPRASRSPGERAASGPTRPKNLESKNHDFLADALKDE
jgi:hypothetical protein